MANYLMLVLPADHGMPFISNTMVEPAKEKYYTRNKYMM